MSGCKMLSLVVILCLPVSGRAQDSAYNDLVRKAEDAFGKRNYSASAHFFSQAFASRNWTGNVSDRYNAACAWARAGEPDSALFQLQRIASKGLGTNYYEHMLEDPDLASLHADQRWKLICDQMKATKDNSEAGFDKELVAQLDSIYADDQILRKKAEEYQKKYRPDSELMRDLRRSIRLKDSLNVIKVGRILESRGWLGPDVVGKRGNSALLLVIQHADLPMRQKYLPIMRQGVKKGAVAALDYATLVDRANLSSGKRQVYGSQIDVDRKTGQNYVLPLEDPDKVDQRRAEVGLGPLSDYLGPWRIVWDVEKYKEDLPRIEGGATAPSR